MQFPCWEDNVMALKRLRCADVISINHWLGAPTVHIGHDEGCAFSTSVWKLARSDGKWCPRQDLNLRPPA